MNAFHEILILFRNADRIERIAKPSNLNLFFYHRGNLFYRKIEPIPLHPENEKEMPDEP